MPSLVLWQCRLAWYSNCFQCRNCSLVSSSSSRSVVISTFISVAGMAGVGAWVVVIIDGVGRLHSCLAVKQSELWCHTPEWGCCCRLLRPRRLVCYPSCCGCCAITVHHVVVWPSVSTCVLFCHAMHLSSGCCCLLLGSWRCLFAVVSGAVVLVAVAFLGLLQCLLVVMVFSFPWLVVLLIVLRL